MRAAQAEALRVDFSRATLDGIVFTDGVIEFSNLDDASCIGGTFEGVEFEGDLLDEVTMRRINCIGCNFQKAKLDHGILDHGVFFGAKMMEVRTLCLSCCSLCAAFPANTICSMPALECTL